jgi:hypothetical protein
MIASTRRMAAWAGRKLYVWGTARIPKRIIAGICDRTSSCVIEINKLQYHMTADHALALGETLRRDGVKLILRQELALAVKEIEDGRAMAGKPVYSNEPPLQRTSPTVPEHLPAD